MSTTPQKQKTSSAATSGSPISILQQWKQDFHGAMEDTYSSYIMGDDAGESARLVLVATPSDDLVAQQMVKNIMATEAMERTRTGTNILVDAITKTGTRPIKIIIMRRRQHYCYLPRRHYGMASYLPTRSCLVELHL